jgi:very-short-patch-repair endonuclease
MADGEEEPASRALAEEFGMSRERSVALARGLRRAETSQERLLWEQIRDRRLAGLKFPRQHPIYGHASDVYCPECRLAVELDGAPHLDPEQQAYDLVRDDFLRSRGLLVLRFMNSEVEADIEPVLQRIEAASRLPLSIRQPEPVTRTDPRSGDGEGAGA